MPPNNGSRHDSLFNRKPSAARMGLLVHDGLPATDLALAVGTHPHGPAVAADLCVRMPTA